MTPEEAAALVGGGGAVALPGGLLNHVWRVQTATGPVVVKYAPPHVASNPEIALDPSRINFEARALALFDVEHGPLQALAGPHARPPRLLARFDEDYALVMEDLGDPPSLEGWLRDGGGSAPLTLLGGFIGSLHAVSALLGDHAEVSIMNNRGVQEVRFAVQYEPAVEYLEIGGLSVGEAAGLGARARALGERFMTPGRCLVMGDLWPRSVMVSDGAVRVFDWEFCHWGRPAQDLGHLAAHLWMLSHRAGVRSRWPAFLAGYVAHRELTEEDRVESAIHFGCEILARTTGAFQEGYLYDGLPVTHPAMREAVEQAASALRNPEAWAL